MGRVARLELRQRGSTTPVWVGAGALPSVLPELGELVAGRRLFAVTSPVLRRLHGTSMDAVGELAGAFRILEVADGESAKTIESASGLWRELVRAGGKRDSVMLAFGGGSVGDLAGFVAATFLRGIEFIQVPTTLLGQVDAAIGGKTGVNLPEAKNSVGAFHSPRAVVADTEFLKTLSGRQIRSGLFEVVKTAVMLDRRLFETLEIGLDDVLGGDAVALAPIVEATAAAKIRVVEQDPFEEDLRRLLNFGHTLGHALESVAISGGGRGALEHGEAVGYGMLFALQLAVERGFPEEQAGRVRSLIESIGLPALDPELRVRSIGARMLRDKKAREEGLPWVLPRTIGEGEIVDDLDPRKILERVGPFLSLGEGC